jgi:hypothetical protein
MVQLRAEGSPEPEPEPEPVSEPEAADRRSSWPGSSIEGGEQTLNSLAEYVAGMARDQEGR